MNRSKKRIAPRLETLENIALLSTIPQIPLAAATTTTTGLGSVGSVSTTDAQALQQDASGGFLEEYISEIEVLYGKQNNVKDFARAVIADHQLTSLDLQTTAGTAGVTLPTGIATPSDVREAQVVLNRVKAGKLDQAYLQVMQDINAQDVASDRQVISGNPSTDPGVLAYVQEALAYDQNHLQGAQQLSKNSKSTYNPTQPTSTLTTPPTVTSPATASDARALQQDASGAALEIFISEIEEIRGKRSDLQAFAQTLVADHQVGQYDLATTAAGVGVTLPSGITQASDIKSARQVLDAVRNGNLDKTYLKVIIQTHQQAVSNDQQLLNSTQDTNVGAYAQNALSIDMTHLQGAQKLNSLKKAGNTYTPGGY